MRMDENEWARGWRVGGLIDSERVCACPVVLRIVDGHGLFLRCRVRGLRKPISTTQTAKQPACLPPPPNKTKNGTKQKVKVKINQKKGLLKTHATRRS